MSRQKTDKQFRKEVYDLVGNEYTFLDTYVKSSIKITVKHNKCGHTYEVAPNAFLNGRRCPYCSSSAKRTDAEFKQEVYNLVGNEYTFLDTYVNATTKLKVNHNKCGKIYNVLPSNFLKGSRCPYCNGNAKKTGARFKQEVQDLVGDEYTVLGSYINTNTKIKIKHNICGTVYKVRPHTFLEGYHCPHCNSSKGELIINKILKSLDISYEYQKSFNDLRDVQPLSYDFYIPSQNMLIEYQGQQHYEPVNCFGGKSRFAIQQKHDKLKAEYAKANGYKLITIPYTEDTFSKIKKYLLQHGLSK